MKLDTGFRKFRQFFSGHYPYSSMLIRVPFILLMALAVSLPFELIAPLWTIGPLSITNVELALFLTLAFAATSLLQSRGKWAWPDRHWLWLLPLR